MKKRISLHLLSFFVIVGVLTSCKSGLSPLTSSYIKAEPQPLELIAGKVPVTINATFPANWFNKKASLTVIPVLRYEGGEAWGTAYNYQGEKVAGNGQVIPQKKGANVVLKTSFDYTPEMQCSQLYLTFKTKVGNKTVELPDVKIGDGVLATAALLSIESETPAIAPDKFQRIIKEAHNANIMFVIQQAELRSSELKKNEVIDWKDIVAGANEAANKNVDIEISSYASPDGGYELNEKLAEKREANTEKYLAKELKKAKVDAPINARYTAQDWEGFKELVEKSNIQDKDLILRVLSMYSDSEQREREIKNISAVYSSLTDQILPQLRRSRLTANIEIIGKSDEEISYLSANNPKELNIEELLYSATLVNTSNEKERIYKKVVELYPRDARAYNNLGVTEYVKGNLTTAEAYFNRATEVAKLPETNLNLGYIALSKGDTDKAQELFGSAAGVPELDNAMAYLSVVNGNYAQAANTFSGSISNNAAVAQLMSKDYNKAGSTLNAIATPDATTYYLKAILGARTNNLKDVTTNLKQSISLNPNMASKALNDVEFVKYITNKDFLNAVLR
ncbi:Flp pilus assembly protein TadD [Dysgonomonadaceae bacterium PH5-43]|nr:Flp pilus assembly protein TadD [Dysgonomonadaceae bacterium PH5-43]